MSPFSVLVGGIEPRQHYKYDAGFDLFIPKSFTEKETRELLDNGAFWNEHSFSIMPSRTVTVPLKIIADFTKIDPERKLAGFVFPRSSISKKGILVHTGVVDAGYTGGIHITLTNLDPLKSATFSKHNAIAQLCFIPAYVAACGPDRKCSSLGSTNRH